LETVVTAKRDKAAALKFLKRMMKKSASAVSTTRTSHGAFRSAKTLQKFSSVHAQVTTISTKKSSRHPRNLQTETLGCAGRMGTVMA
jgi:hypothetical protein